MTVQGESAGFGEYRVERRPFPDDVTDRLVATLRGEMVDPRSRVTGYVFVAVMLILGIWLFVFRGAQLYGAGAFVIAGLSAVVISRGITGRDRAVHRKIAEIRATTSEEYHRLVLGDRHVIAAHEHGVVVLTSVGPGLTFVVEVSFVSDDPLEFPMRGAVSNPVLPRCWTWWGDWPQDFQMTGEPIALRWHDGDIDYEKFLDNLEADDVTGRHVEKRDLDDFVLVDIS